MQPPQEPNNPVSTLRRHFRRQRLPVNKPHHVPPAPLVNHAHLWPDAVFTSPLRARALGSARSGSVRRMDPRDLDHEPLPGPLYLDAVLRGPACGTACRDVSGGFAGYDSLAEGLGEVDVGDAGE